MHPSNLRDARRLAEVAVAAIVGWLGRTLDRKFALAREHLRLRGLKFIQISMHRPRKARSSRGRKASETTASHLIVADRSWQILLLSLAKY